MGDVNSVRMALNASETVCRVVGPASSLALAACGVMNGMVVMVVVIDRMAMEVVAMDFSTKMRRDEFVVMA